MVVRAINSYIIIRSVSCPPFCLLRSQLHKFSSFSPSRFPKSNRLTVLHSRRFHDGYRDVRSCCAHTLVESVMEELDALQKRNRLRVGKKMEKTIVNKVPEDNFVKELLREGYLLEFKKDSETRLLAVAQGPDGKKSWMVHDQNGFKSSIKLQQITYIVPGIEHFQPSSIHEFVEKARNNVNPLLLEFAWIELLEKEKSVTAKELAEMIFGSADPVSSYSAHLLLSKDDVYFNLLEASSFQSVYGPRAALLVQELLLRKCEKESSDKEFDEFIQLVAHARTMAYHDKPKEDVWIADTKSRVSVEALVAYAVNRCNNEDQKNIAEKILKATGMATAASEAVDLLVDIGYFPLHVNVDLLKANMHIDYSDEAKAEAENLLREAPDLDEGDRDDLSNLKVYAIDVDEADELDDALSGIRLQDGRIKVWIHVADPTSLVRPGSVVDREALKRGTSIFLPTATYPMFPEKLAMEGMSLKQGKLCKTITISVILHWDGSIAEYSIRSSCIRPTYMLTYESASELLYLDLAEEVDLKVLHEAAMLRLKWRCQQGAVDTATLETRIKVANPDEHEPSMNLYVQDNANPASRTVSEMMILCGEVVADYGSRNNILLPYRGQPQHNMDVSLYSHLPRGPVRSAALVKSIRAAEMNFRMPMRHRSLGLPGYVQFTSPIRRYMDLVAHYQVKAHLRGEALPFSIGRLEGIGSVVNMHMRATKKLSSTSLRYWTVEFLRRQPRGRKFRALILKLFADSMATVVLMEVGCQASVLVSRGGRVGDTVDVQVEQANPRRDLLYLKAI